MLLRHQLRWIAYVLHEVKVSNPMRLISDRRTDDDCLVCILIL